MFTRVRVVRSKIFVDCGGVHQVNDTNGEQPHTCMVAAVTQVGTGWGVAALSGPLMVSWR
jgi:hypothetical protein